MTNFPSAMPWSNRLLELSPAALDDTDAAHIIRRRRIGIFSFWVLTFLSITNVNAVAVMALGTERLFSVPMLIAAVVTLLVFQMALLRDMGVTGMMFIAFIAVYLGIALPVGIQNFSIDIFARAHGLRMYLTSVLVIAACAQGARHTTLAWSKRQMLFWLFLITLVQVVMVFAGMFFPTLLYAKSGPLVEGRFSGFFRNPNEAGMASCACMAVGFAYLTVAKRKLWVVGCLVMASVSTVLTFSRSSFVTLFALIVLQVLISPVIKRKSILFATMMAMAFLVWFATIGVFSVVDTNNTQSKRLASLQRILTFQVDMESDTGGRLLAANVALKHCFDSPILGNGFTTMVEMEETGLGPHNQFLLIWGEGGIFSLSMMILFCIAFMYVAWRCKDRTARALGLGIGFVFVCSCMVNHTVLTNRSLIALLGVCMGIFAATAYRSRVLKAMASYATQFGSPAANGLESQLGYGRPSAPLPPPTK